MLNGNVYEHANELVRAIVGDEAGDADEITPAARRRRGGRARRDRDGAAAAHLVPARHGRHQAAARCLAVGASDATDDARATNTAALLLCVLLNEVRASSTAPWSAWRCAPRSPEQCLGALLLIMRNAVSSPRLQNAATCLKEILAQPGASRAHDPGEGSVRAARRDRKVGQHARPPRATFANCAVATLQRVAQRGASFEAAVRP